jgi:hypothetical protein
MDMTVHVQPTPNPNARKFVLPDKCFPQSLNFPNAQAASEHDLAAALFGLEGVYNVFFAQDFVTVNKRPDVPWEPLTAAVEAILDAFLETKAAQRNDPPDHATASPSQVES